MSGETLYIIDQNFSSQKQHICNFGIAALCWVGFFFIYTVFWQVLAGSTPGANCKINKYFTYRGSLTLCRLLLYSIVIVVTGSFRILKENDFTFCMACLFFRRIKNFVYRSKRLQESIKLFCCPKIKAHPK